MRTRPSRWRELDWICSHEVETKRMSRQVEEGETKIESKESMAHKRKHGIRRQQKKTEGNIRRLHCLSPSITEIRSPTTWSIFLSLQMKAGAFAQQSDQLRVSPSLVLVRQIFSALLLNEACAARHCGANNSASFCAQMSDPVLTVSCSHNHTDKISKSTFIA